MDNQGRQELVASFHGYGVWRYRLSEGWANVHPFTAARVPAGDLGGNGEPDLVLDFGPGIGLSIRWNGALWFGLHNLTCEDLVIADLDGNGRDDLVIDFGAAGLCVYADGMGWRFIHSLSPEQIVA